MPEETHHGPPSPRLRGVGSIQTHPRSRRSSQTAPPPLLEDGYGPIRHPRPMTAAELHLEVEKEQEALVNRLTRELSELRARTSSVVSTTSTTSTSSILDQAMVEVQGTPPMIGTMHPTSSRSHRSSSSISRSSVTGGSIAVQGTSQASVDRARDAAGVRSRTNSTIPPNISSISAPVPPRDLPSPRSRAPSVSPAPILLQHQSGAYLPSASRYEEAAAARSALEGVRKENDLLATRVRVLEAMLRHQSQSANPQGPDQSPTLNKRFSNTMLNGSPAE